MKEAKDFLMQMGIDITIMVAGLLGALLMISKKSAFSIKTTLVGMVTGMISANYLTELVISVFNMTGNVKYGIAFLLGYTGLKSVEKLMNKFHKSENND